MLTVFFLAVAIGSCYGLANSPVTPSVYREAKPLLWTSQLIYAFSEIVEEQRKGNVELELPPGIPTELLTTFQSKNLDFTDFEGTGNGIPFGLINEVLEKNMAVVKDLRLDDDDGSFVEELLKKLKARDAESNSESFYLETCRTLKSDTNCVYSILKDTNTKKIIVVFRGSVSLSAIFQNRDWQSNLNSFFEKMRTPPLLRDQLEGDLSEKLLVHRGFYEYLFDNKVNKEGSQRYDMIIDDLKKIVKNGYKIWVTGHSLGGALSSTTAFKLAGSGKDWIPKPITCVSFASPFTGGAGYRTAFEQLEKNRLLKYIRFTNKDDLIPSGPPALSWRRFKHVGVNVRLYDDKADIHHSSRSGWKQKVQNSLFIKPIWRAGESHGLKLHLERLEKIKLLKQKTIDEVYNDHVATDFFSS